MNKVNITQDVGVQVVRASAKRPATECTATKIKVETTVVDTLNLTELKESEDE